MVSELCAKNIVEDPEIYSLLASACNELEIDASTIKVYWNRTSIVLDIFSDFVWGNSIFLNKTAWYQLSPALQKWSIWHNVAHIKRRDYALEQIKFGLTYGSGAYLFKRYFPFPKTLKSAIVLFGLPYLYLKFIQSIEFQAHVLTAQALCKRNQESVVRAVYHHYKFYNDRFCSSARPAPFFPTYKELTISLYNVLNEYDLLQRLLYKEKMIE